MKTVDLKDEKRRSWYETRFAVESDKLFALGTICMYTTDKATRRAATFALLLLSRTEKRQLLTASILERISSHKGYSNVEVFLREEEMYFLHFWMKIKRDNLVHLPIVFTSPTVLRDIARLKLCHTFSVYRKYGAQEDEEDSLCECTAKSYISQNVNTIVSQVITSHLSDLEDCINLFEDSEDSKEISEDNMARFYLLEVADECTDGVIKVLITKCFPIVYVRLLPLLASTKRDLSVGSTKVMNNLRSILPDMDDQIRKKSQILLRESINLDAKSLLDPYEDDYLDTCFHSSIVHISKVISSSSQKKQRAQSQALSINSIEAILQLRNLLENSQSFSLKSSVWKTMEFVMSFIQENSTDTVGFEFCIRSLLALGHHEKNNFLFNVVMKRFLSLLDLWIAKYSHVETFLDTMSVLASTLQLYEYYQSKILQIAERNTQNFLSYHRHAKPLGSIEDNTHIPEKPYNYFRNAINNDIAENISLLHDIISKLFHFRGGNGRTNLSLVQGIDPASLKTLQKLDSKFTLDSVMQVNDELSPGLDLNSLVDYYIEASTTFIQSAKSGNASFGRSPRLDPEERSFLRSLDRLNTTLNALIEKNQLENSMINKFAQLQDTMVKICSEKVHSDIQVIASKISGDIGIFCLSGNSGGIALEESCTKCDTDEVLHSIFISTIGLLSRRIESINITEANFAKDTLKLIAVTKYGQQCRRSKDIPSKSAHLLQSFGDKSAHYGSSVSLPASTLRNLYSSAEAMIEEPKDDSNWCWNDSLWKICPTNHCFPTWVKNIVSSIIICCYDTKSHFQKSRSDSRPLRGGSDFFGACLLMTSSK